MRKLASSAIAVALAGVMAIPAAPANAQSFNLSFGTQDRFVASSCRSHPGWRGCSDWRRNHMRWSRNDFRRWYGWNRPSLGNFAAGLFGFAVGAAIVNGINSNRGFTSSHVARCEARFRSYDPRTDMYLGFDGNFHRCRL